MTAPRRPGAKVLAVALLAAGAAAAAWYAFDGSVHAAIVAVGAALLVLALTRARGRAGDRAGEGDCEQSLAQLDEELGILHRAQAEFCAFESGELFRSYFLDRVHQLAREMEAAAVRQSLDVSPRGHTTRPLLASMAGDKDDVCKFVHHLDNNEFFFTSSHSIDFFERIHDALTSGTVVSVKRLFVWHDVQRDLADPGTQELLSFHENVDGYEWMLIGAKEFQDIGEDEDLYDRHLDFGIYGSRYAYVSTQRPAAAQSASGEFIAAKAEVARYSDFFDLVWNHGVDKVPFALGPCATLEELFPSRNHLFRSATATGRTT